MASRIIIQLLVAGAQTFARAASQAWRQAIINGQKAGVGAEGAAGGAARAARASGMSLTEAHDILGCSPNMPWEDVLKRYDHLMKVNEEVGSFYLQSKVYRAKERIEQERNPAAGQKGGEDA